MKKSEEMLEVYDLQNTFIKLQPRQDFYNEVQAEFVATGTITKKVKSVRVILMTSDGRLYLQRRSSLKEQNRGLYDKTTGGHFISGHTWELTLMREMIEELGIPAVTLNQTEFNQAITTTDLSIIALFKQIDEDTNFLSVRTTDTTPFVQPFITRFYVGYYNGAIKFHDGEASGIEVHSLQELQTDIFNNPAKYTQDLKVMIQRYSEHLVPMSSL